MSQPLKLQQRDQNLKTLVHGDLWHNNIYFDSSNHVLFNEWQMCHTGTQTNDLCFFLLSSTTTQYRQNNWDKVLRLYYDTLISTLRDLVFTLIPVVRFTKCCIFWPGFRCCTHSMMVVICFFNIFHAKMLKK